MPRRYDERDDYDEQPRRRQGASPVLIVAIVLGGVLLLGLGCLGLFTLAFWAAPQPMGAPAAVQVQGGADAPAMAGSRRVYKREEFDRLVMGKTPEEVIAAVGKPDETEGDAARPAWFYGRRTRDPLTGTLDYRAGVRFEDGKAFLVFFF